MKPSDGNQSDSKAFASIVKEHISSLQKVYTNDMVLIADAALYTANTLKVMREQKLSFISRVPASIKEVKELQSKAPTLEFKAIDENYQAFKHIIT